MVNVAVICVADETDTLDTVIFCPAFTVAPEAKPAPVIVTGTAAPTNPMAGDMLFTFGLTVADAPSVAVHPKLLSVKVASTNASPPLTPRTLTVDWLEDPEIAATLGVSDDQLIE